MTENPYAQFVQNPQPVTVGAPNPYKQQSQQQDLTKGTLDIEGKRLDIEKTRVELEKAKLGQEKQKQGVEQAKASGFYQRAINANKLYEGFGVGAPSTVREAAQAVLPNAVVNSLTGNARQQAEAAQRDFVMATLRYESGAAIPPEELESQRRTYFPVAGDTEDTIKLKAQLRSNAIQALQTGAGGLAVQPDRAISDKPEADVGYELTPQQQTAYDALVASGAPPEQLKALIQGFGGRLENAGDIAAARDEGAGFVPANEAVYRLPEDLQQRNAERLANTGTGEAAVAGAADTLTAGTFDELSALGDAIGDTLEGGGFNYSGNLAAERAFLESVQQQNPGAYLGGQLAGGLVLPTFGARTAGQLAGVGAGYGAAYGAGSGEDPRSRMMGALTGAGAGGATGYAIGRIPQALSRSTPDAPPLVGTDGRLNEPLEALRPGQRVAAAQEFGVDLPLGAATDRGGAILEKGLDILPGSAGVMNDARRITEGQVSNAVEGVASKFGSAKTLNEAGGEAQRGAREWMGRFEATAAKAYDAIPISPKAQASVSSTVARIDDILGRFSSNPELAGQMNSPKLQQMREAIAKGLSWEDLKALRSRIGYEIGEQRFSDSPTKDDLRAVYAALSEDMQATAASMGPRATQAFNRANTLYRQGQERIDKALVTLLGNDGAKNPEAAAKAIQAMTMGGKGSGDLAKLAQVRAATVKSGAWDEIASALIRIGGQPVNSPGRSFSPQTFIQWYSDMAEPARAMLFKPELRKTLDQFVAVNQRLAAKNALRNTSQTAPNFVGAGVMGGAALALVSNPLLAAKMVAGMGANYGMAKLWTSPKFVQWATGYSKALRSGPNAVNSQIGRLQKLATTNPELRQGVETLLRNIANDNTIPRAAASADPEGNQQQ